MQTDQEQTLRRARRKPIIDAAGLTGGETVDRTSIKRLIPHRGGFLLVDTMTVSATTPDIALGTRWLDPSDPVFKDHFPGTPIYPGVLLVEAMAQLALAARAFHMPPEDREGLQVRLLQIAQAHFVTAAGPGDEVTLACQSLEDNGFTFTALGQALRDDTVIATAVIEAMDVET